MGKSRQQQKVRLAPFVPLFHDELESTAYRTLTASAAKLLPYFKRVCVRASKGAPNETTIFGFTYTEAEKYGFISRTFIAVSLNQVQSPNKRTFGLLVNSRNRKNACTIVFRLCTHFCCHSIQSC